jgi:hypothetical protein
LIQKKRPADLTRQAALFSEMHSQQLLTGRLRRRAAHSLGLLLQLVGLFFFRLGPAFRGAGLGLQTVVRRDGA